MKAAILVKSKHPLVIEDIKPSSNLEYGQVYVKLLYSGICGAQINEIDAVKGEDKFLPHLLGHEGSGIVERVGKGVINVKEGDHVVLHWRCGFGINSSTPKYFWNNKIVNAGWVTTFNEYAIVSENRLTKIPKDFDLKIAPLFGCAVTTAVGVINNDAQVKIGQSVIIFGGGGGVGLNLVQASSMVSANPIIAIDIDDNKLNMSKSLGATHTINIKNYNNKDLEKTIYDIVGSKGADVVIDTTGNVKVIEMSYNLTNSNGKTILVGVPKQGEKVSIYTLPLHFNKVLTGSHGGSSNPSEDIPRLVNLYNNKKLNLKTLITHEFCLDDINKAINTLREGSTGDRKSVV